MGRLTRPPHAGEGLLESPVWAPVWSRAFPSIIPLCCAQPSAGEPLKAPCHALSQGSTLPRGFPFGQLQLPKPQMSPLSLPCDLPCSRWSPQCCLFRLCPAGISLTPEAWVRGFWGDRVSFCTENRQSEGHVCICSSWSSRAVLGPPSWPPPSAFPQTMEILSIGISFCALLL